MPALATVKLSGLEALDTQLKTLPIKVQRRAMIAGLRAGALIYKRAAKASVPVRSGGVAGAAAKFIGDKHGLRQPGFLKRGIISRTVSKKRAPRPTIHVGPRRAAFYGQFFEVGRAGPRRMPRRHFMREAFRTQSGKALKAVRAGLWKALKKEIVKNARN
jgi:HK97 gp10 family phage protein